MVYDMGPRIRKWRRKMVGSQGDLAQRLEKSPSTISSYERDGQIPSLQDAVTMADIFGVSLDSLVAGEKAEVLSVKKLNEEQRELVQALILELQSPSNHTTDLSTQQLDLLRRLFHEFAT